MIQRTSEGDFMIGRYWAPRETAPLRLVWLVVRQAIADRSLVGLRGEPEWRVVHYDPRREVYTLERTRRFFKGAYRAVTTQAYVEGAAP